MMGTREINGSQKRSGLSIKAVHMVSFILMMLILTTSFCSYVLPNGTVTLETTKVNYIVGESVIFSGSGYSPNGTSYEIRILHDQSPVVRLSFISNGSDIPSGVSWTIPFGAENGTYVADAYNVTQTEELLAWAEFQVVANATTRLQYLENELAGLKDFVISNVTINGINNSLLASLNNSDSKLESALALFQGGENKTATNQLRAARNMLTAFVHKVLAQCGKKIDNSTALTLIEAANDSIVNIDSMIVSAELPLGKQLALNVERTLAKQERHIYKFVLGKELGQSNTDEDLIALVNNTEGEMASILARVRARNKVMTELWANGSIDSNTLVMELAEANETAGSIKEVTQLPLAKFEELNMTKPGLGKHLGQFTKIAKELVNNSTDAERGMGEQMSNAKSQVQHGKQQGDGGGKGKGSGNNGNHSHKKGGSDHS